MMTLKTFPAFLLVIFLFLYSKNSFSQSIGTFNSVTPSVQTQGLVLPPTHTFQQIIQSGDALSAGGTLATNPDFTGYVPIGGSSINGYLSISSENTPAAVGILDISFSLSGKKWLVNSGGNVPFPTGTDANGFGETSRFCSGTVTPNNTIIVCEEDISGIDNNSDGYTDRGWLIEVDPVTRTVINQDGAGGGDKLWAIGRASHENAAINKNNLILYTGVDDGSFGYLYKFIPAVAGNFSSGTLYVLQTTTLLGAGTWKMVANTTKADRNNTRTLSQSVGAYNFNGIEDVEIGPDGKIYFAAKNLGVVYRFSDNGSFGTATDISDLEIFVGNSTAGRTYDIDGAGALPPEPWGLGNDNLAFDGDGNLWVLQDGIVSADRNHIWVVGPTHTQASPKVRVFATTPKGSEPTGITFTPDYRFLFLSFMHPDANTASQFDATGVPVIFNKPTTVVISRFENLGSNLPLPVTFTDFTVLKENNTVKLNWKVTNTLNHSHFEIERSSDGKNFEKKFSENKKIPNGAEQAFHFIDRDIPLNEIIFYRLKQIDNNGFFRFSVIRTIKIVRANSVTAVYPNPSTEMLNVNFFAAQPGNITVNIFDEAGQTVIKKNINVHRGNNLFQAEVHTLKKGNYTIAVIKSGKRIYSGQFIKL